MEPETGFDFLQGQYPITLLNTDKSKTTKLRIRIDQ